MVELAATIFADGPSSDPNQPMKPLIRDWGTWVEGVIAAFFGSGGKIYQTKAALSADLSPAANSSAWVMEDPVAANNGVYRKVGGTGTGSWARAGDLPFSFIIASDAGAGTANAIQATTSIPVSSSALVWANVFEANTASPVTISFNGGSALTVKTNSGNDVAAGGLVAGMVILGIVSGSTFRLVSDQASAAIAAAAEAAKIAAEAAAAIAIAAATGINLLTVVDRPAMKAVDTALRLTGILAERTREGVFYPRLISSLSAAALAAMAVDTGEYIYVPSTDDPASVWIREGAEARGFWSNSATPAYVHRLRERVMIGESAGFDCSTTPDTNTGAAWLHTIKPSASRSMGYIETHGRVVSTGQNGPQFVGATRLTGAAVVEGYGGIFHVRNESTNNTKAWGLYIDAIREDSAAGHVAGIELDVANCTGVADVSMLPYGLVGGESANGWTYGLNLASGADVLVNPDALPASHALGIINNGSRFNTGIVIRSDALVLDGGGYGRALTIARQHKIGWYGSSDGLEASYLTSTVTQAATGTKARFTASGFELLRYADDKPYARFLYNASAVNYYELVATAAGTAPIIRAAGDDTNLNIVLQPKNTGVLQLTYAATTTADIASNRRVRIRVAGADIDLLGVLV